MERKLQGKEKKTPAPESNEGKRGKGYEPWNLKNWMAFLMERAPPLVFLLLAAGPCCSGLYSKETGFPVEKFIWALLAEQILLLTIRVMDDVKDYEIDKVVHPDRPLPRGLIKYEEVVMFIKIALLSMVGYGLLMCLRFGSVVGGLYLFQVFYGYLMYLEFGIGEWLDKRPFLYSFTHEISVFIGALFISTLAGQHWTSSVGVLFGCIGFSGFFVYDICRKLDPHLPKLKGTYLVIYGKWPVFGVTSFLVAMAMVSSYLLDIHGLLWPLQLLMIGSLLALFLKPTNNKKSKAHKPVEYLAVIFVLGHMWLPFIAKILS